jgi:hypothetical protein
MKVGRTFDSGWIWNLVELKIALDAKQILHELILRHLCLSMYNSPTLPTLGINHFQIPTFCEQNFVTYEPAKWHAKLAIYKHGRLVDKIIVRANAGHRRGLRGGNLLKPTLSLTGLF